MGQAEGEFRGEGDVILKDALTKCTDDEWPKLHAMMRANGLFTKDYENKMSAALDLDNMDSDKKNAIAQQLKDGEFELDE